MKAIARNPVPLARAGRGAVVIRLVAGKPCLRQDFLRLKVA